MKPGSNESIRLHEALYACKILEVFDTEAIKCILEYKWKLIEWKTYFPLVICIMLVFAVLLHTYNPGEYYPLYLLLFLVVLLIFIESYKLRKGTIKYVEKLSLAISIMIPIYVYATI